MSIDWADLRLFLDVARLGGLSAATETTGLSAATLGRRVTALEKQVGEPLFHRSHNGYALTGAGEELLRRAEDVEAAMTSLTRWRDGTLGERVVRVSAGTWTTEFLAQHLGDLWSVEDPFRLEFVTAYEKIDIGRRNADIGIRTVRPVEPNLAGRLTGHVAHAIYAGRHLINGVKAGFFVGLTGDGANLQATRWMMAHHGDRVGVRGNDMHSVRELVAAGGGLTVMPCFAGDADKRLVQVAPPIPELMQEQWLVTHQDERHSREVRLVLDRIGALLKAHGPLFAGEVGNPP
jgi:DNA-binding transcriptional LysR family regulator